MRSLEADPDAPGRDLGHPHPQRRRARRGQLDGRGRGRHPPRAGARSTATASAPATPTWCRSWPTSRSRRSTSSCPAGGGRLEGLTELSRSVAEIANLTPNDYQPYVGRSAFAHKGGVHGAAVAKVERSYQHVEPGVGRQQSAGWSCRSSAAGRTRRSGRASSATSSRGRRPARALAAHQAARGRRASHSRAPRPRSSCSSAATPPTTRRPFRIVDYTCLVEQRDGRELLAEATVKVAVDGETLHTAADGNGPVNALDAALRKALRAFYPAIDDVHLVDYKVRILDGDAATAARTRVIIDSQDGARTWSTMGSDTNIIAASAVGARRLPRVRDLEVRRGAAPARRATLHDGSPSRTGVDVDDRRGPDRPSDPEVTPMPATTHSRAHPASRPLDRAVRLERPQPGRGHHRCGRPPLAGVRRGQRRDRRAVPGGRPGAVRDPRRAPAAARLRHPRARRGDRHDRCRDGPDRAAGRRRQARHGRVQGEARGTNIIAASIEAYIVALNALLGEAHWEGAPEAAAATGTRARRKGAGHGGCGPRAARRARRGAGEIDTTDWFNQ